MREKDESLAACVPVTGHQVVDDDEVINLRHLFGRIISSFVYVCSCAGADSPVHGLSFR